MVLFGGHGQDAQSRASPSGRSVERQVLLSRMGYDDPCSGSKNDPGFGSVRERRSRQHDAQVSSWRRTQKANENSAGVLKRTMQDSEDGLVWD